MTRSCLCLWFNHQCSINASSSSWKTLAYQNKVLRRIRWTSHGSFEFWYPSGSTYFDRRWRKERTSQGYSTAVPVFRSFSIFTKFPNLPPQLRLMIWRLFPLKLLIEFLLCTRLTSRWMSFHLETPNNLVTLFVNRESRKATRKRYIDLAPEFCDLVFETWLYKLKSSISIYSASTSKPRKTPLRYASAACNSLAFSYPFFPALDLSLKFRDSRSWVARGGWEGFSLTNLPADGPRRRN
jgi:hypothetical protein